MRFATLQEGQGGLTNAMENGVRIAALKQRLFQPLFAERTAVRSLGLDQTIAVEYQGVHRQPAPEPEQNDPRTRSPVADCAI